ncbi:Protein of unknown function [Salinibacillus kushneri]|uniref:DUF3278 domain-containing protein n=1 Tax=Salinibacillus kushneri TaxID=237682 RepID=A0A1I0GT14_9BACI|nr:DUF3278 domain-containing protein [Salinibacillus kushneri]SET74291.1 Protein of unknown function [Salinibacillus kushneri]
MREKLLNHFIGAVDNRDEYQQHEIYKELAFSGILLWYLSMLLMFVSLILDTIHNQFSLMTLLLFIINMVYATLIMTRLRKRQLDETDCASIEEYRDKRKRIKKSSILAGIQWGLFMFFIMQYLFPYLSTGEIVVNWVQTVIWGIGGILYGTLLYQISKSKLKKHF